MRREPRVGERARTRAAPGRNSLRFQFSGRKPPASSCTRKEPSAFEHKRANGFRKPGCKTAGVEDLTAGDELTHGHGPCCPSRTPSGFTETAGRDTIKTL